MPPPPPSSSSSSLSYGQDSSGRYADAQQQQYSAQPPPSRPERRRPVGSTPSPATMIDGRFPDRRPSGNAGSGGGMQFAPSFSNGSGGRQTGMIREGSASSAEATGGQGKNRRMMDQLNMNGLNGGDRDEMPSPVTPSSARMASGSGSNGLQLPRTRRGSGGSSASEGRSRNGSPRPQQGDEEEQEGEVEEDEDGMVPTAALNDAISAFSAAGTRRDGRRGGLADQGYMAQAKARQARSSALNPQEYPDTPAFREIEAALKRCAAEWPVLMYGTTAAAGGEGKEPDKEFDPVTLALGLLDPSSEDGGSRSLDAFLDMKAQLDHAISSTLSSSTTSYRAYESSITTHNSTLQSLGASQRTVNDMRKQLMEAREKLEGKGKEGLVGMYNRMSHLEEMAKLLDEIDHFRTIPDRLEGLLSEKRFLSAVVLLVRSLKTIKKPEMMEIGALTDLRSWLIGQESVLLEILIEELHNHLYLKSFYCDVRWKSYSRGQSILPLVDFGDDVETTDAPSHLEPSFHTSGRSTARLPRLSKLQRYLNYLSLRPSVNPLVDEPIDELQPLTSGSDDTSGLGGEIGSFSLPSSSGNDGATATDGGKSGTTARPLLRNPELDSFAYIESLMESLAVLGKLGYGLDAISQRVQGEVFTLIENTVEEVEERNDTSKQSTSFTARPQSSLLAVSASNAAEERERGTLASLSSLSFSNSNSVSVNPRSSVLRLTASETAAAEQSVETLKDLFWTLYSKLDAVLQGFRVSYEVALRISERRDFKDASGVKSSSGNLLFSLLDVWKPVQLEVRSLLHDYMADDQSGTVSSRNPIVSVNEVLRLARPRDHTKQMFRFAESDLKASNKILKAHEDSLNRALKAAVPGLLTDATANQSALVVNSSGRVGGGVGGTHKALVRADAFNVSVLFGPTLAFLDRVKEIMPGGMLGDESDSTGFSGFLDEFVVKTFLPQLEEKVSTVFHQAVGGLDAFQEDSNYRKVSRVPIVKSVPNLMVLITSLCSMLRATPFHRDNYSHLIVSVIHQFFQRCRDRFRDLVASEPNDPAHGDKNLPLKMSAMWAEAPEINGCLADMWTTPPEQKDKIREMLKQESKVEADRRRNDIVHAEDFVSPSKKLLALGTLYSSLDWFIHHVTSLNTNTGDVDLVDSSLVPPPMATPRMDGSDDEDVQAAAKVSLPLTNEMSKPFEALLKSYRQLANIVLFTLRLEIRLRTVHYLDKATRDGVYQLAEDIAEPDPSVVELNSALAEIDECAATTLAGPERKFIFEGLSLLMDQLLIHNARHIRLANKFGVSKMNRNILALQQNLKNIGETPLEVNFDRSRTFWEVFAKGPKEMLDLIRAGKISYEFEDYKSLLNLMCGIDQSAKDANGGGDGHAPLSSGTDKPRRLYNEYLIDLFALDVGGGDD